MVDIEEFERTAFWHWSCSGSTAPSSLSARNSSFCSNIASSSRSCLFCARWAAREQDNSLSGFGEPQRSPTGDITSLQDSSSWTGSSTGSLWTSTSRPLHCLNAWPNQCHDNKVLQPKHLRLRPVIENEKKVDGIQHERISTKTWSTLEYNQFVCEIGHWQNLGQKPDQLFRSN